MALRIALTGSSGLVGSTVVEAFSADPQTTVLRCVRPQTDIFAAQTQDAVFWDPLTGRIDRNLLEGLDLFVHLAGENIASERWNARRKQAILESRVMSTRFLVKTFAKLARPPRLFVCASATGFYGHGIKGRPCDETRPAGRGFLADVCRQWEDEAMQAASYQIRTVCLRLGVVLSARGGMISRLAPLLRHGLAAVPGPGTQLVSWVASDEIAPILRHVMRHQELCGPINAVSPHCVHAQEFYEVMAAAVGRRCRWHVPSGLIRLILGEMADEIILGGVCAAPARLVASGYQFQWPDLTACLKSIFQAES